MGTVIINGLIWLEFLLNGYCSSKHTLKLPEIINKLINLHKLFLKIIKI